MRRVTLLTAACVVAIVLASCQHDGRSLRPAKADQASSISVADTVPAATDGLSTDTFPTATLPGSTLPAATGDTFTLPGEEDALQVVAPWRDGAAIDARYTCDGLNVAPALSWSPAPEGTAEIAITLEDRDAPGFVHWVIAGISPSAIALNEDTVPLDAYEATNGGGDLGYTGPCPPAGSTHAYVITVHYLDSQAGLDDGVPGAELITMISSVETATAEVTGTFSRP